MERISTAASKAVWRACRVDCLWDAGFKELGLIIIALLLTIDVILNVLGV